jgi:malonate decarboxylase delta subunit
MEHLSFDYPGNASETGPVVVVGVVSSGNLEVMVEPLTDDPRCLIDVRTPARGFDDVWAAVLADFVARARIGGVRVSINDVGATPAVVSLRLDQAVETFRSGCGAASASERQ